MRRSLRVVALLLLGLMTAGTAAALACEVFCGTPAVPATHEARRDPACHSSPGRSSSDAAVERSGPAHCAHRALPQVVPVRHDHSIGNVRLVALLSIDSAAPANAASAVVVPGASAAPPGSDARPLSLPLRI